MAMPDRTPNPGTGILELLPDGAGVLRAARLNYEARSTDPFVPPALVRKLGLRGGEEIEAEVNVETSRGGRTSIGQITSIAGLPSSDYASAPKFDELTPINPERQVRFETAGGSTSMRVVDLLTPIGLGQRGLIVAPPRTGKTVLLQQMAAGLAANHPDVYMIVLLVDERPEEVTEMRRSVHGEVIASSNDRDIASHVRIARLVIERAKRLVERGRDVFILLDSLTRLGRAFNAGIRGNGRIMSGGLDSRALVEPKSIFGAARKIEHGGSLTIIASALIDTGSRMDEVIFNEFKGTGNMEIVLSREMANRRIWPAIDLAASGTRKEEQLLSPATLEVARRIRRVLLDKDAIRGMELLTEHLDKHPSNDAFVRGFNAAAFR